MLISLNWLKEFVDISASPRELAERLTMVGLQVESTETVDGDTILDLEITTNRPDCLSHLGVAREIAAIYGLHVRTPKIEAREVERAAKEVFAISISDPDLCGRYCGRYIEGVRVGPSPDWVKKRLEATGVRPINNVADVTNYVLMELGHPLHAFDADTLEGRQIIVRRAELNETLRTLDGMDRQLNPSMLVIADLHRPVALAGLMGGHETEISLATANVLLESAWFAPLGIRKTSRSLNLVTEASYRFERGADIEMASLACDRAAAMIQQFAGGKIYRGVIDVYPAKGKPVIARLARRRIQEFLGMAVADEQVEAIFERLGFRVRREEGGWLVEVPTFRVDVSREEDLLEEIARHHGFEKFPATLPKWAGHGSALPSESEERLLRDLLARAGYSETYGLSFGNRKMEEQFAPDVEPVELLNPLSEDASILRASLVPAILRTIQWNLNRGIRDLQLFEIGKVYRKDGEYRRLILAATGSLRSKSVHETERDFTFYDLKGDVEALLDLFNVPTAKPGSGVPEYHHPKRFVRFGEVANLGELRSDAVDLLKLRQRVYIAEVDLEALYSAGKKKLQYAPIPRFPSIRRDFSLLLDRSVRYADVLAAIGQAEVPELVRVEPFDQLEKGPFPESKYSLSISLFYQSPERTLTDGEAAQFDRQILRLLENRVGARLRE